VLFIRCSSENSAKNLAPDLYRFTPPVSTDQSGEAPLSGAPSYPRKSVRHAGRHARPITIVETRNAAVSLRNQATVPADGAFRELFMTNYIQRRALAIAMAFALGNAFGGADVTATLWEPCSTLPAPQCPRQRGSPQQCDGRRHRIGGQRGGILPAGQPSTGDYSVVGSAAGFANATLKDVKVDVTKNRHRQLTLQVGQLPPRWMCVKPRRSSTQPRPPFKTHSIPSQSRLPVASIGLGSATWRF